MREALRVLDVRGIQRGLPHQAHVFHAPEEDVRWGEQGEIRVVVFVLCQPVGAKKNEHA